MQAGFAWGGWKGVPGGHELKLMTTFVGPQACRESSAGLQPVQAVFAWGGWKGVPGGHELKLMTTL